MSVTNHVTCQVNFLSWCTSETRPPHCHKNSVQVLPSTQSKTSKVAVDTDHGNQYSSVQSIPTLCKINAAKWLRCNLVLYGSFFQHGNNSGKRDTVAFHGACIECNMNVDAMGMSIATLKCLAFQTYMTLYV